MKKVSIAILFLLWSLLSYSQTIEEGRKFFNYERYISAKQVFEKLLAANPANAEAAYWLGQTLIAQKDIAAAKSVYQNALTATNGNGLIIVGTGQIDLIENRLQDARNKFEQAMSISKFKDINVINAVGRANANVKEGDKNYAIEKLKMATTLKGFKDPETYIVLGEAYRRLLDGGNAVTSFNNAIQLDPRNPMPYYKIGKIYETQRNEELFKDYYSKAINADPNFIPVYYALYNYYFYLNVNISKENFDKYAALADQTEDLQYDKIDVLYVSKNYNEAISQANALIQKLGNQVRPRIYRLLGYSYKEVNDWPKSYDNLTKFIQLADPEDITPKNYELTAISCSNLSGKETEAFAYFEKAIALDTIKENRSSYTTQAFNLAKKLKNNALIGEWAERNYYALKKQSNSDLFNLGKTYYDIGMFQKCDSVGAAYFEKYPTQTYGVYLQVLARTRIDTTYEMAFPQLLKLVEIGSVDSVGNKNQLKLAYQVLISIYANNRSDYTTALNYCQKILNLFPDDAKFIDMKDKLEKVINPQSQQSNTGKSGNSAINTKNNTQEKSSGAPRSPGSK